MKILYKCSFFLVCLINILTTVKGQTNRNDKIHLPIQVIVNPNKAYINPEENVIESESKAIEVKIQSDENNSGKIDLTIAAAKEVKQAATETLDRYSPQYNAANDQVSKDSSEKSKGDHSPTVSPTSRQDQNTLYQPLQFGNAFEAMRKIYGHPQPFLFGTGLFSPLQNLRHYEENLAREVLPRAVVQGNTAVRNADNEPPLGMVMAHPLYSVGFSTGMDVNPRLQSTNIYNPHPYLDTFAMINPQTVPVIQSIPINQHPITESSPQRNPERSHQHLPYRNLVPQSIPVSYQTPHSSENDRHRTSHKNPENNPQSQLPSSVPETHSGVNYAQDSPIYGKHHEIQHPSAGLNIYHHPTRNINEATAYQMLQNSREINPLYRNPLPNRQQQIANEGHDRHLYYTPLSERDPVAHRNLPTYPSPREIRRPIDASHLHRTRIIPQENSRETHQTHSGIFQYLPQSRIPTSPPRLQHIPHYTVIPHENLPKYLQNPTYSDAQKSPERNIPKTRHSLPGSMDGHSLQPYHSLSDSQYESPHPNHRPHHSSERDASLQEGYRSLPIGAMTEHSHPNHQPHHSSERDESLQEGYRSLPIGAMTKHPHPDHRPRYSSERDESLPGGYQSLPIGAVSEHPHPNHRTRHSSERDESLPGGYQSLPISAMSEDIHHASTDKKHQIPPVHTSKPAYSSESTSSREIHELDPTISRRHKPIGKVYSVPQYQLPSRESQHREDEIPDKRDKNQQERPKRRRKYKLNEMEPHKKEVKKRRKSLKSDNDDLQAHSSHQYIIKIG